MRWSPRKSAICAALAVVAAVGPAAPASAHSDFSQSLKPAVAGSDGVVRSWLEEANYLRRFFNAPVPQLTEDPALSRQLQLHAHYDTVNNTCGHSEDPSNPHYTVDGNNAAGSSVLWCGPASGAQAVAGWIRTPIHGEQVLNPQLTVTGFSDAAERAGMNTLTHAFDGAATSNPLTWPNGVDFPLRSYGGAESPDPYQACPIEYRDRASQDLGLGQPFFVYLRDSDARSPATTVSFGTADGTQLPFCLLRRGSIDATFPFMTAAILLPLQPLKPGVRYLAQYVAGTSTARWDVTTSRSRVSLALDGPLQLVYGDPFTLAGSLNSDELAAAQLADLPLTVLADGQPIGQVRTGADGRFQLTLPYRKASWTVRFDGDSSRTPGTSPAFVTAYDISPAPTAARLSISPATAAYGTTVRVSARLVRTDRTANIAGQQVQVQSALPGQPWAQLAVLTTDGSGLISVAHVADRNRNYRVVYGGATGMYVATDRDAASLVSVRVPAPAVQGAAQSALWSGQVAPGGARTIRVQYRPPISYYSWHDFGSVRSDSAGRYRIVSPLLRGRWQYRIVASGTPGTTVTGYSPVRVITR